MLTLTGYKTSRRLDAAIVTGLTVLSLAGVSGSRGAETSDAVQEPLPVSIALQWLPQSQFAGYYMAVEKGFYKARGLDVSLVHAGPGPSSLDLLANGRADFCTLFLGDAILYARKPVALAQAAQFVQKSNLMLVGWKDMGILTPADLDGKRISYWPGAFSIAFTAFFKQHNIHPNVLPQHHSVNLFLHRGVSACAAMYYNEYHRIYQAGYDYEDLTLFLMRDYGLGFPEDGLYTRVETAERQPDVCIALREATMTGWAYAKAHPEEALDAVLQASRAAGVPANRPHSRWMLEQVLASIYPETEAIKPGYLDAVRYQETVSTLKGAGLIDASVPFDTFFPVSLREQP
jgi:NitT/TauT family transport system substrate-binding protein